MKKIFLIDYLNFDEKNGGSKFDKDLVEIFKKLDIPIKLFRLKVINSKIIKLVNLINLCMYLFHQKDTIYFFRHPLYLSPMLHKLIYRIMRLRNNKLVGIIADLEYIRWKGFNYWYKDIQLIKNFDYVIVHNDSMVNFLKNKGIQYNKIINLEATDYLANNDDYLKRHLSKTIVFSGNLGKSLFLNKLKRENDINIAFSLNLYGDGFLKKDETEILKYKGSFSPDDIIRNMEGSFGLVWDGNEITSCAGTLGEYMKINNPHKLSMYIVAGLPVIVWKEAAVASLVKKYNIGFVIDNLLEINIILEKLTEREYEEYINNVMILRKKIMIGYHFENAINKVLNMEKNKIY